MKKGIIAGIVLTVIVGIVAAVFIMTSSGTSPGNRTANQAEFSSKTVDACSVLTEQVASEFLGEKVVNGDSQTPDASTDDIVVSNCAYSTKYVVGKPDSLKTASLLARSAKTIIGADSNRSAFEAQRPAGAQSVEGYGEAAYWNPYTTQLNILKNDNWYIIIGGSTTSTNRSLDQTRILADRLVGEL